MQIEYKTGMYLYNKTGALFRLDNWGVYKAPFLYCYDNGIATTLKELSELVGIHDYKQLLNMYYKPFYLQPCDEVTYKGVHYRVGDFEKSNYSKAGFALRLINKEQGGILITKETLLKNEKIKLEKGYLGG